MESNESRARNFVLSMILPMGKNYVPETNKFEKKVHYEANTHSGECWCALAGGILKHILDHVAGCFFDKAVELSRVRKWIVLLEFLLDFKSVQINVP